MNRGTSEEKSCATCGRRDLPLRAVDVGEEVDEMLCVNCERELEEMTSDPVIDPRRD